MGEWITIEETYWTVCWKWIFPYPCRKSRTVRRWCLTFDWLKETRWFLYCSVEGCAQGRRYSWGAFCFNIIGTAWFYNIRLCFSSEKQSSGTCG
jgi:hypothetical protein